MGNSVLWQDDLVRLLDAAVLIEELGRVLRVRRAQRVPSSSMHETRALKNELRVKREIEGLVPDAPERASAARLRLPGCGSERIVLVSVN